MTRSSRPFFRRRGNPGRRWALIFGLVLLVSIGLFGAEDSGAAAGSSGVRITSTGSIGPLQLGRSDKAAITSFAGEPQVDETNAGAIPESGWEALGYECGPRATTSPLMATAGAEGPYCRTVYYLNSKSGKLGTFFTSMRGFKDAHGVSVGMRTAKADRLEGKMATGGCGAGIFFKTSAGTYHVVIAGGQPHRRGNELVIRGGRAGALVLHSRTNDVGSSTAGDIEASIGRSVHGAVATESVSGPSGLPRLGRHLPPRSSLARRILRSRMSPSPATLPRVSRGPGIESLRQVAVLAAGLIALALPAFAFTAGADAKSQGELPVTPTTTFGAPREWQVRPHRIYMGDSACSPQFTALHWLSYGPGGGRAVGQGRFPHLHALPDSCDRAFYRSHPKHARLVVSRPRYCDGQYMFTRIGWRAHGERGHYVTSCD